MTLIQRIRSSSELAAQILASVLRFSLPSITEAPYKRVLALASWPDIGSMISKAKRPCFFSIGLHRNPGCKRMVLTGSLLSFVFLPNKTKGEAIDEVEEGKEEELSCIPGAALLVRYVIRPGETTTNLLRILMPLPLRRWPYIIASLLAGSSGYLIRKLSRTCISQSSFALTRSNTACKKNDWLPSASERNTRAVLSGVCTKLLELACSLSEIGVNGLDGDVP
mmetsp:Transcript_13763/g.26696  ORF Transcript_13763/g.26696 Transcript_13763/m.26696 type:complete len:223 (+) Transcript_13763:1490-2158(+)